MLKMLRIGSPIVPIASAVPDSSSGSLRYGSSCLGSARPKALNMVTGTGGCLYGAGITHIINHDKYTCIARKMIKGR